MIPFIDLQTQQQRIKSQLDAAIQRVLAHGKYIMGPEVPELELKLRDFVGAKHCITVSSGTDALVAALMAYDVGPGDAVITTPFTFFATVEAIMLLGAMPVFADVDNGTLNICPDQIELAIARVKSDTDLNVRGIIPVDLYGLPADYSEIHAVAEQDDLFVLQDAAQSFGAIRDGKRAPTHGHVGITSFFPAKPLGCYGDGGAVFTDDDELADRVRSIRVHGKGADKYDNVRVGLNARLDTIQAAILLEKLSIYADEFDLRQQRAAEYRAQINELNRSNSDSHVIRQEIPNNCQSAWAQYVIRVNNRDELAAHLSARSIPNVVYYRTPAHLLKACHDRPLDRESLPCAEGLADEVLALPFHPYLDSATIRAITSTIGNFVSGSMQDIEIAAER